jgi:predicted DNA-binding transcriptional regulator YafY
MESNAMTDLEPWLRMIKIIQHLVRRESLTVRDLYHLFDNRIPIRTLQRDMEKLANEPDIPVELQPQAQGRENRFYIAAGFKDKFSRAALSTREAIAGKIVARSLGVFRHTALEQDLKSFEAKFSSLIPNSIFEVVDRKLEKVPAAFETFQMGLYDYSGKGEIITGLIDLILERRQCRILGGMQAKESLIWPLKMVQFRGTLYLYGAVDNGGNILVFALHRIVKVTPLNAHYTFTAALGRKLRERERQPMGIFLKDGMKVYDIVLRFDQTVAGQIAGRHWHATQKIKKHPDGSLTLKLRAPLTEELTSWILWWKGFVTVLSPQELILMTREAANTVYRKY